jgi:hypothetical protein
MLKIETYFYPKIRRFRKIEGALLRTFFILLKNCEGWMIPRQATESLYPLKAESNASQIKFFEEILATKGGKVDFDLVHLLLGI